MSSRQIYGQYDVTVVRKDGGDTYDATYTFLVRRNNVTGEYIVWNPFFMRGQADSMDDALRLSVGTVGVIKSWRPK